MIKLLIADDEQETRSVIREMIPWEENGISVCAEASDGQEAIREIEAQQPDIVLLDIHMPVVDGLEVARYIAKKHPCTKTIILSGHDEFSYAQQALKSGVSDYLLKPCRPEDILASVIKSSRTLMQSHTVAIDNSLLWETQCQFFSGLDKVQYAKSFSDFENAPYLHPAACEKALLNAVSIGNVSEIPVLVQAFFCPFYELTCTRSNVINSTLTVLLGFYKIYESTSIPTPERLSRLLGYQKLDKVSTIQELHQLVRELACDAAKSVASKSSSNCLVNMACRFIQEHYSEPLDLNLLAAYVHITPSYLSLMFKQVTGTNFIDYLNQVRIEQSCILLKNLELKTYEISSMVGFRDEKYFSRVFKRLMGCNPSIYRKLII